MRKMLTIDAALLLLGGTTLPAMAQGYASGITRTEINNFNSYLKNHPKTAQELAANPSLAKNPNFYGAHPGLESFLANHPGVRQELNHNPGQFTRAENGGYQRHQGNWQGRGGSEGGCRAQARLKPDGRAARLARRLARAEDQEQSSPSITPISISILRSRSNLRRTPN